VGGSVLGGAGTTPSFWGNRLLGELGTGPRQHALSTFSACPHLSLLLRNA
jgi:hypothetical protein